MRDKTQYATFAGGCFWCSEHAFLDVPGVLSVTSGYTGGDDADPTYEAVCGGDTGHAEAVQIAYDPEAVSYGTLLDIFWRSIDPTDDGGQFADRGSQYRTAIFYHNDAQKTEAEASKDALEASGRFKKPVATAILEAEPFYPAEEYHQKFSEKNPQHFRRYHVGSGKEACLLRLWDDPKER